MTNKQILTEIQKGFNLVQNKTNIQNRKGWTREFFKVLLEIGKKKGYKVYTCSKDLSSDGFGGKGWLFDVCWSEEGKGENDWKKSYKGLKLICESEWSMSEGEILHDFQKLAVAKAEIKIMIVQYDKKTPYERIKKWCEDSVDPSLHEDGSIYILAGSGNNKNDNVVMWEEIW